MTAEAKKLHVGRGQTGAKPEAKPEAKPKKIIENTEGDVVPVTVLEPQPKQDFDEFYPLHVTKVEEPTSNNAVLLVPAIIIITILILGFVWYKNNQNKTSTEATPAGTSTKTTTPAPAAPTPSASTPADTGATQYVDKTYGFTISYLPSWKSVTTKGLDVTTEPQAEARIEFDLPGVVNSPATTLLVVRVDTKDMYTKWIKSVRDAGKESQQKLLGQSASQVFSAEYFNTTPAITATAPEKQAIADVDAVIKSFALSAQ